MAINSSVAVGAVESGNRSIVVMSGDAQTLTRSRCSYACALSRSCSRINVTPLSSKTCRLLILPPWPDVVGVQSSVSMHQYNMTHAWSQFVILTIVVLGPRSLMTHGVYCSRLWLLVFSRQQVLQRGCRLQPISRTICSIEGRRLSNSNVGRHVMDVNPPGQEQSSFLVGSSMLGNRSSRLHNFVPGVECDCARR
jgi:hypothetical protein